VIQLSRLAVIVPEAPAFEAPADFVRYALLDRGRYGYAEVEAPAEVTALASEVTSRALRPLWARVLRLDPGDYVLAHHDPLHEDHRVDVIVDLSPAVVDGAEVRYARRGATFFRFPSQPGAAAIVERDPTTRGHHTYVSKRHTRSVVRLVVQLVSVG